MLENLSKEHQLFVIGNMTEKLPFASAQSTYPHTNPSNLNKLVTKFSNVLLTQSNKNPLIAKLRDRYNNSGSSKLEAFCSDFFAHNDVDIFYVFPFYPETFYFSIAKKFDKPLICEFWEDQVVFNAEFMHAKNYDHRIIEQEMDRRYDWFKAIVNFSSSIIVPSHIFRKKIESIRADKKIDVIRVCAKRQIESDSSPLRRDYGIENLVVVYYSSSVSPWHDIDTLKSAVQKMKNKTGVVLILTGDRRILEEKVQSIDGIRIILTGTLSQEEAAKHLCLADICVAPYRFHYSSGFFPGKIVRYMMAGKAVIATELDEVKEVLSDAGLLVAQCDADGFAKSLDLLIENRSLRHELGRSAMKIALEHYDWDVHSKKIGKVFDEVYSAKNNL